jgi:hypothetical protein
MVCAAKDIVREAEANPSNKIKQGVFLNFTVCMIIAPVEALDFALGLEVEPTLGSLAFRPPLTRGLASAGFQLRFSE